MPADTLEEIRLLSNLETEPAQAAADRAVRPARARRDLAKPEMRQLRDRITHSFRLRPLTLARGGEVPVLPHARGRLPRARGVRAARRARASRAPPTGSRGASTSSPTRRCSPPSPRTRTRSPTGTCAPRSPTRSSRRAPVRRPLAYLAAAAAVGRGRRRGHAVDALAAAAGPRRRSRRAARRPRRPRRRPAGRAEPVRGASPSRRTRARSRGSAPSSARACAGYSPAGQRLLGERARRQRASCSSAPTTSATRSSSSSPTTAIRRAWSASSLRARELVPLEELT